MTAKFNAVDIVLRYKILDSKRHLGGITGAKSEREASHQLECITCLIKTFALCSLNLYQEKRAFMHIYSLIVVYFSGL